MDTLTFVLQAAGLQGLKPLTNRYNNIGNTNDNVIDDNNVVTVLYFNWKTWENNVYKIKETSTGAEKAIPKDDSFDPPKDKRTRFQKVAQAREDKQ